MRTISLQMRGKSRSSCLAVTDLPLFFSVPMDVLPQTDTIKPSYFEGTKITTESANTPIEIRGSCETETPYTLSTTSCIKMTQGRLLFPTLPAPPHPTTPPPATPLPATPPPAPPLSGSPSIGDSVNMSGPSEEQPQHPLKGPAHSSTDWDAEKEEASVHHALPEYQMLTCTSLPKETLRKSRCGRNAIKQKTEQVRAEILALKEETRLRREQERLKRELEKRDRLEQEEKLKQGKREQRERERREKHERRERERQKKEEERKRKEEERRRREEERRQAELEKKQSVEEKLRKEKKAKELFVGFFSKLPKNETLSNAHRAPKEAAASVFTTFEVQQGMSIAPPPRPPLSNTSQCDTAIQQQNGTRTYLQEVKGQRRLWRACDNRWHSDNMDCDDVMIMSSQKSRFKLFQYHDNVRPAYFGSWRKRSTIVSGRHPFRRDQSQLDYEFDSDAEWEEEEPGESVSASEGEEESGSESEEEDGFFVPHGYLSEDEEERSETERGPPGEEMEKVKARARAWEAEFQRTCLPMKVTVIGCLWMGEKGGGGAEREREREFLRQFSAMTLVSTPVDVEVLNSASPQNSSSPASTFGVSKPVPEEAMPDLIAMVHNSSLGKKQLLKSFRARWGRKVLEKQKKLDKPEMTSPASLDHCPSGKQCTPQASMEGCDYENASCISKRKLEMKIKEIATKGNNPTSTKSVWTVHSSVLEQYKIDPSQLAPLSPSLTTPRSHTGGERQITSPATLSNKSGTKRRLDGTPNIAVLFKAIAKSPKTLRTATTCVHQEQEIAALSPDCAEPRSKKVRVESVTTTRQSCGAPLAEDDSQSVIIINSDSSDEMEFLLHPPHTKENRPVKACSLVTSQMEPPGKRELTPHGSDAHTSRLSEAPPSGVSSLQERTNQLRDAELREAAGPCIDWKELLQTRPTTSLSLPRYVHRLEGTAADSTNTITVTAEIH